MWGQRQAARALGLVGILLAAGLPAVEGASSNPAQDYAGSDVILVDTTWTGEKVLTRGVVIPPGRTLTIENATVKWNTSRFNHFGFFVEPRGTLIVRDSLVTINSTFGTEFQKTESYWDFFSKGRVDVQRSTLRYGGDISLEFDLTRGSILRDVDLLWMSRGVHVLRTNLTNGEGWDLVMENVRIADMPVITGSGSPDIGGAIGVLNGNVKITNVTIERARTTGLFIDRSAVSDDTESFGNRIEARGLVVIGGSPPGMTGQGALMQMRTTGSFLCEQCTFISPVPGGGIIMTDGAEVVMRDTTIVDATLGINYPATTMARYEGLDLRGPSAGIRYIYGNAAVPVFERLSFDAGTTGGVLAERLFVQDLRGVWWGDATGPRDPDAEDGSVPATNAGQGRPIVGSVNYEGWLTTPPPRDGLRLTLSALPEAVAPGAVLSATYTVENAGDHALDVDLRTVGVIGATVTEPSVHLEAGESATGMLTFTVPATAAPATIVGATLLAVAEDQRTAAHAFSVVGAIVPRVRVTSPLPYQEFDGAITASGVILEPTVDPVVLASTEEGGPIDANGDDVDDRAQLAPGHVSVLLRHEARDTTLLRKAIEAAGGHVIRDLTLAPLVWAYVPAPELAALAARDDVRDVWWDEPVEMQLAYAARTARARSSLDGVLPGGLPPGATYQGVWSGNPEEGYHGPVGRGVLMAVIDSGIDPTHASLDDMDDDPMTLDPKIAARISTFTILATEAADVAVSSMVSPGIHGTFVAGTAAGTGAQFTGPVDAPLHGTTADDPWMQAGVAPGARIVDIDAFEDTGDITNKVPAVGFGLGTIAPNAGFGLALEGFEAVAAWNRDHPNERIRVVQISLSVGSTEVDHPFNDVANALAEQDVLIVVAVGNNHPGAVVPGSASKVLAVGATKMFDTVSRLDDGKASFSDVSNAQQLAAGVRKPELMAPGSVVSMPKKDSLDAYANSEGTSFAAPIVSGVAALVFEANSDLHAAQVKEILVRSAEPRGDASGQRYTDVNLDFEDDLEDGGWDPRWGYGYVDAEEAVRLARETKPRSPPVPPILKLFAAGDKLRPAPPTQSAVAFGEAEWTYEPDEPLSIGDGDPTTEETALLVLAAPLASLGPSSHLAVASLYRDDELVSRFTLVDDRVSTSATQEPLRIPLALGRTAEMVLRGPDTGRINVTGALDVLDEDGTLQVAAGQALRLLVEMNHTGGADSPIVTGPSGTHITLQLDPQALPNGAGPSAVAGTNAEWNASSVDLAWGPAADDRGIASYRIYRDGEHVASVSGSKHAYVDAVGPGETHAYRVRAVDLHGVVGPLGPEVVVVTPAAIGRSVVLDVAGTSALASDLAGDGSHATWSASLAPTRVGRHQLRATLFVEGSAVSTQVLPITIRTPANVPPVVTLPDAADVLHGMRSIPVAILDANGDEDVVAREWRIDDGPWRAIAGETLFLDAASMGEGLHTIEARATDSAGAEGVGTLSIDAVPWTATIHAPDVIPDGVPTAVIVHASGVGLTPDALRLVGSGPAAFDLALAPEGDALSTILPPLPSGLLRLEVRADEDLVAEATRIVDRPPVAVIVAPDLDGTRLDTLLFVDASTDDTGFAARLWSFPDGTTSTAPVVARSLRNVSVGDHPVGLTVTNAHGLTASASVTLHVEDLAPVIAVSPFRLFGASVTHAYTGEPITLEVNVTDPEQDPLVVGGGLVVDGVLVPAGAGLTPFAAKPVSAGVLDLVVSASDAWKTTTTSRSIPVHANTPPIAVLTAPALVDALSPVQVDTRASRDPDRAIVSRVTSAEGIGNWTQDRPLVTFPMGVWDLGLTVVDTSGAEGTTTRRVVADDWLHVTLDMLSRPSLLRQGEALVTARWFDSAPASGASYEMTVRHGELGLSFHRTYTGTLDETGRARVALGTDVGPANVPGAHDVTIIVSHASRPDAPVKDVETAAAGTQYQV